MTTAKSTTARSVEEALRRAFESFAAKKPAERIQIMRKAGLIAKKRASKSSKAPHAR